MGISVLYPEFNEAQSRLDLDAEETIRECCFRAGMDAERDINILKDAVPQMNSSNMKKSFALDVLKDMLAKLGTTECKTPVMRGLRPGSINCLGSTEVDRTKEHLATLQTAINNGDLEAANRQLLFASIDLLSPPR